MRKLLKLSVFLGLFLVALVFTVPSYAINDNSETSNAEPEKKFKQFRAPESKDSTKSANKDKIKNVMTDKKTNTEVVRRVKLSEARLRTCEEREAKIGNRFKNLLAIGKKTHAGMDKIVERVDKFYNDVLVLAGYTLPNYDSLKSDMTTKKVAVQTALTEAQASGQSFSCDSDDPKGQADAFRQDAQALINANKAYKTSVRTFVAAVRDLAKEAKADKLSPSPVVTETP